MLLQHIPPGWLILQEGQEQRREPGRQQKGKEKSKVQRKEMFARAVKNPAQKGQERKQNIRNRRQTELFRLEEISKILEHEGWGRMGKYEHAG